MGSRKMSFFETWRSKTERGELLQRASQLRLLPSQLEQLLGDSAVRAELQNTRIASLLPPVGTEVFRRLTPASLEEIQQRHEAEEKERPKKKKKKNEKVAKSDLPKPASDLKAGKQLPFFYGDPPPELLNTPLEELDPYYQSKKTFIVLGKGNIIHRFNAESACYLLSPFNLLRTAAIKIHIHFLFRLFILVTVLTNCVFMTMSNPPEWREIAEHVFTAIYTLEVLIKMMSRGLCFGSFTFLRDPWNWLDILVVLTGVRPFMEARLYYFNFFRAPKKWLNSMIAGKIYLTWIVSIKTLSVLRTVTRVLKIITVIPGLKKTVGDVVQSLRKLADVITLMVFWLCLLALIALQLFMGSLKHKCIISSWLAPAGSTEFDFTEHVLNTENQYHLPGQLDPLLCGNSSDSGACPEGYTCLRAGKNPNYGYTSYDSFGWSLLNMVRLMTQDFWENLMQLTLRSSGSHFLVFFMGIVFPGCFCVLSLIMVMVAMAAGEREDAGVVEAREGEDLFTKIVEVLKRREEEEAACRAALSEKSEGENKSHKHTDGKDFCLKLVCCVCCPGLQQWLHTFITNPFFDLGIVICLIINTIFISMEHYPMTAEFEEHLAIARLVFTGIFTAEMIIKLVAMGPCGYFKVPWNIYDSIIVIVSLLELGLADVFGIELLRVFRLSRWWPSFHLLLKIIWMSLSALRNLTLLLLIMVFFFTVVGMQLFGSDYKDCVCRISADCELPRWHMNDFFHSFLVIMRVLYGEWIELMWDCMEVSSQAMCLIFFMMVMVIGNLLVLNLFLTLLMSSFSSESLAAPAVKEYNHLQTAISQIKRAVWTLLGKKTHMNPDHTAINSKEDKKKDYMALTVVTSEQPMSEVRALSSDHDNPTSKDHNTDSQCVLVAVKMSEDEDEKEKKKHPEVQQRKDDEDDKGNPPEDCCSDKCYRCCPCLDIDTSQGGGRVWSNFRRACCSIIQHKYFEYFVMFILLLSSAAMMFEDIYLHQRPVLKEILLRADQVFTLLFLIEMLLKIIAFGLKKYFTDTWCWLDFLILDVFLVSLAADTFGFSELGAIQSLRTLRALGPLRILSRAKGLRLVVQTMVRSFPFLFDALLVSLVVCLIFSIGGATLFAGKFYYCFNETSEEFFTADVVNNRTQCFELIMMNFTEVRWKNVHLNFDSVANGYLALLHLALSSDFYDVMYAAVDSRWVESQPVYENSPYMYMFFIFFIIISSFFTLNFFIRAILDNLQRNKSAGKDIFITEEQHKEWMAVKKRLRTPPRPVPRPQNACQAWLFDLVTKLPFNIFMAIVICLNMVLLMVETDQMSIQAEIIQYWFHLVFILIFLIEFILKIIALRQHYFADGWNVLDFLVLIFTIVGMFLADLLERYFISPSLVTVLRLFRVGRMLPLIRFSRGIRKLLFAFMMSLPAFINIGLLLFIIMFTSSLFGMFNFAYAKRGAAIDDITNFETFWKSMSCLFVMTTSASWGGLLLPLMTTPPDCDPHMEHPGSTVIGDCSNTTAAIIFFVIHITLSILLVVHLFVAVVLETLKSEDGEPLSDDELQMFYETWRKFDPEASQFISYSKLSDFCDALKDPLRIPKPNSIKLIHMDLPLMPGDKIHCVDVLFALSTQVFGYSGQADTLKARIEEKFVDNPSKVSHEPISSTLQRKQEDVAAAVIQRAYRKHILQHRGAEEPAVASVNGGGGVSGGALQ
ncbi:sodium channel protein type 4 subunit alpha B-like isoform X3 [Epinephelus lanceolatus]